MILAAAGYAGDSSVDPRLLQQMRLLSNGNDPFCTGGYSANDERNATAELKANGLQNAYWTFNTYQASPGAGAPSPATVQAGIQGYRLHGMSLGQLLDIYLNLANDTFGEVVTCGLNNGAGILVGGVYAGRIVAGCAQLPNQGQVGMEKEFNTSMPRASVARRATRSSACAPISSTTSCCSSMATGRTPPPARRP